jgi:phage regulator Rha-like protein
MATASELEKLDQVSRQILVLRGQKVLLDADLAVLYGVRTKRLLEQVKRNRRRFPPDFVFRVSDQELINLRSQIATSSFENGGWGGKRYAPYAFTEHGALMAANVLHSKRAIDVSIFVVRAFVRLRDTLMAHKDLARKLNELEKKTESLASKHDVLAATTRDQFRQVIETLRQLMAPQEPRRKSIGFVRQN